MLGGPSPGPAGSSAIACQCEMPELRSRGLFTPRGANTPDAGEGKVAQSAGTRRVWPGWMRLPSRPLTRRISLTTGRRSSPGSASSTGDRPQRVAGGHRVLDRRRSAGLGRARRPHGRSQEEHRQHDRGDDDHRPADGGLYRHRRCSSRCFVDASLLVEGSGTPGVYRLSGDRSPSRNVPSGCDRFGIVVPNASLARTYVRRRGHHIEHLFVRQGRTYVWSRSGISLPCRAASERAGRMVHARLTDRQQQILDLIHTTVRAARLSAVGPRDRRRRRAQLAVDGAQPPLHPGA